MNKTIALSVALLASAAGAATNTWTLAPGSGAGQWSTADNWDVKPTDDGTADVVFVCDPDGSSATEPQLGEGHSVNSLYVKQGKTTNGSITFGGSGTLTVGAGGATFTNYTEGAWSSTKNSYSPNFNCPVAFSASQGWSYNFNGSSDSSTSWDLRFLKDWSSGPDVELTIAGPANRISFEGGSSANFGGRVNVGLNVHFSGANQFSRLGTNRVTFSESPLLGWPAKSSRSMMCLFKESSVGYLDTPLHFDFESGTDFSFGLYANMINSSYDTELHIRGKWTGRLKSDKFKVEGPGDMYTSGLVWNSTPAGQFRPEQNMIFFENDLTELEFYSSETWKFKPNGGMVVIASPKAEKLTSFGNRLYSIGRSSRIRGILGGDGVTMNNANERSFCVYVTDVTDGSAGGPILLGAGTPGTCHYKYINSRKANSTSFGETPLWFYSVTNGVAWFDSYLYADGSGSASRALPLVVWGRGDIVFNFSWVDTSGFALAPVWVRGGRLRIKTQTAAATWPIRVGAPVAGHKTVRVMQVDRLTASILASLTASDITFNTGKMPAPDGVTLATGDRVCVNVPDMDYVKSGSTTIYYNGIYAVDAENEKWTRVDDFDEPSELVPDIRLDVQEGAKFGGRRFFLLNDAYRIAERRGVAQYAGFKDIGFIEEMGVHPSCSLLTEGNVVLTNSVTVTQNESTNRCEVGANVAGSSGFSGPFTIERDFTLSAVADGVCTFSGQFSGSAGLTKEGAGSVVLTDGTVAGGAFSVTNLTLVGGSLTMPGSALAQGLDRASVKCVPGGSTVLSLGGDVDLSGWTFEITDLYKPERDEPLPASFRFSVTSSDGGTVSGTPSFVLSGSDTSMWSVGRDADGWVVSCRRPGMIITVR